MARVDRVAHKKKMESDMRQFGGEMSTWADTHSEITDQVEPLRRRWDNLNQRMQDIDKVSDEQWNDYILGLDRDFADLRTEYQRTSSRYSKH